MKRTRPRAREKKEKSEGKAKKGIGTMNLILIIVGVAVVAFTVTMIRIFTIYGAIPDTLCTYFFIFCGGEYGIMGWIKSTKEKNKEREWQKADEQEAMNNTPAGHEDDDGRDPSEM